MTGRDPLTTQCGRRAWLILGVALVFLWGVPQSGSAAPAGQTIAGYVQNADLRRVARATVELRDQEGTLVTSESTTAAGEFTLVAPHDGVFSVQAVQDTYRSEHVVITVGQEEARPDRVDHDGDAGYCAGNRGTTLLLIKPNFVQ